jgi:hypothetical protein
MKTNQSMWKRLLKLQTLLILLAVLNSCGKSNSNKDNTVVDDNGSNWNNPGRHNTPIYNNPNVNSGIQSQINQIKGQVGCATFSDGVNQYTGRRLNQMVTFSSQGHEQDGNSSTIDHIGPLNQGPIGASGNQELYVGVSVFGDLLFVTKYSQGFQATGYTYTISFCESEIQDYYSGMRMPVISDQSQVVQMTNDSQTILDASSYASTGQVDAANITAYFQLNSQQFNYGNTPHAQYAGYGMALPMVTTFFPLQ